MYIVKTAKDLDELIKILEECRKMYGNTPWHGWDDGSLILDYPDATDFKGPIYVEPS